MSEPSVEQSALLEVASGPGRPIGKRLTLFESEGRRAVFFGPTAIQVFDVDDGEAEAACMAMLSRAGLASDVDIAAAFGVHRNTVGRIVRRFASGGLGAVVPAKRGPKGPSKVTPEVMAVVAAHAHLSGRELRDRIADATGVRLSVPYVYQLAAAHRPGQGQLVSDGTGAEAGVVEQPETVTALAAGSAGVAGDELDDDDHDDVVAGDDEDADDDDRPVGGEGLAFDPPVSLPGAVAGRYMGLTLYYPALAALGLVEVARAVFRLPRSVVFGVRAVTLSLLFMTLLRKGTVEAAKHLRRVEFGAVVGSGRAPAVKTLRRKLAELVGQAKASEFGVALARRWVDNGMVATAYLYVDGHMKVYSGKRRLQEIWNSQRRMPLPGVNTYFVNDAEGRPLLFLTEALSTNLAKAMPRIVDAIREVIGERPFTVIFDRGGYDGKLFKWLTEQKIGFITYQRANPNLPKEAFSRKETRFEGRRVRFFLAEDTVKVGKTGPWRRVVIRTKDGHQTPILTNLGAEVGPARIACLMLARWRQENVFKYMGEHHGLDQLLGYGADPADPDALIPNPQRRRLDRQIAERRKELAKRKATLGDALLEEPKANSRSAHGLKIAQGGVVGELRRLEADIDQLVAARKALPTRVPVAESGTGREVMRLEHKAIVDRIKISAYNAEEWMLDRLIRHYPNHHDARDLLRSFAELSGEIRTTNDGVVVTLDPPDTPIHRRALRGLVDDLNTLDVAFPGTDVPVTYQVAMHHSEAAA
ncbi:MAG: putative transposase [Acidimicrobiia bacterium]